MYKDESLPNITGTFGSLNASSTYSGAFADAGQAFLARYYYDTNGFGRIVSFDASRSSDAYISSISKVRPDSFIVTWYVKY